MPSAFIFATFAILSFRSIVAEDCDAGTINTCISSYFDKLKINFTKDFQEFQVELNQFYSRYPTSEGEDVFCEATNTLTNCMGSMWPGCMNVPNAISDDAYAFVAWFIENPTNCHGKPLQILKDNYKCIGETKKKYYVEFGKCYTDYIAGVTAAGAEGLPPQAICTLFKTYTMCLDGRFYKECSPKVARVMCDSAGVGFNYLFTSYCDPMCEIYGNI